MNIHGHLLLSITGLFDYEQLCEIFSGGIVDHMAMACRPGWEQHVGFLGSYLRLPEFSMG